LKNKYQGILIIPILLAFYFVVGTPEFNLKYNKPSPMPNVNELDYSSQIENIEVLHADIEDKLQEFKAGLEELKPDESIPLSLELQIHLKNECEKYGVDINEAVAIMTVENETFNPKLKHKNNNGTYDWGLFQVNDCWIEELKGIGVTDLLDPKQNITAGTYIISKLDKHEGEAKFVAYNAGEGGMKKLANRGITSTEYSRKVMGKLRERE
jgi:hypothetical protein